jgi:hypothetical protein
MRCELIPVFTGIFGQTAGWLCCKSSYNWGRMNSAFNSQILAEKLRKLNNSQQSIESILKV